MTLYDYLIEVCNYDAFEAFCVVNDDLEETLTKIQHIKDVENYYNSTYSLE